LDLSFDVNVSADACNVPIAEHRDVKLPPVGAAGSAVVNASAGPKNCGQE
jgi:hypothetical protein